ncbi:MAG: hypothetical protein IRZ32_18200, partial [Solirubrobacteraceae bacterium]|nr:hypothetical protein [Solirubrobacteraceae bacterium]
MPADERLERELRALPVDWPPAPDVAAAVAARLRAGPAAVPPRPPPPRPAARAPPAAH